MTDDEPGAPDGAPPKLTIGQRLLTALPNLQRAPAPPPSRAESTSNDSDTGEIVTPDAVIDADGVTATGPSPRGRLRDGHGPQGSTNRARGADAFDAMSREEIVNLIKKVDDRERSMALVAAGLGVVVGIALTAIAMHINPPLRINGHLNSKHETTSLLLLEGGARILLSGIVVAAAMWRRRSFIGFSLLFLGTSMGAPLFALPFWALGGYLIWRVFKYQRVLNARGGGTTRAGARGGGAARAGAGGRVPANPRGAARAGVSAGRERAQASRQRGRKQPEPKGPTPSKRYTPPKPVRPRPPAPPT